METMGERIKRLRQLKGITQEELAKIIGLQRAAIAKYEIGIVENMKQTTIKKMADYFGVKPSYLMCLEDKTDELGNPVVDVPLLGIVKAGYDYLAEENWEGTVNVKSEFIEDSYDYFALKIKGNSMSPSLIENDIVLVRKQDDFDNGNIVVVLIDGDEATVKKVQKTDNGIKLIPINLVDYEPLFFTDNDIKNKPIKIIGVVQKLIERNF